MNTMSTKTKTLRVVLPVFLLIFSLLSVTACAAKEKTPAELLESLSAEAMNAPLPDVNLTTDAGSSVSLAEITAGKTTIISIWRSGCEYCQIDAPKFAKFETTLTPEDNVQVVHVSWDTQQQELAAFKDMVGITQEVLLDPSHSVLGDTTLQAVGTPTHFVVNKDGVIVARITGARGWDEKQTEGAMKSFLKTL